LGLLVTEAAQDVLVITLVVYTVEVMYSVVDSEVGELNKVRTCQNTKHAAQMAAYNRELWYVGRNRKCYLLSISN
jgi:hypothetical protein